jgi:hypothetical protein
MLTTHELGNLLFVALLARIWTGYASFVGISSRIVRGTVANLAANSLFRVLRSLPIDYYPWRCFRVALNT